MYVCIYPEVVTTVRSVGMAVAYWVPPVPWESLPVSFLPPAPPTSQGAPLLSVIVTVFSSFVSRRQSAVPSYWRCSSPRAVYCGIHTDASVNKFTPFLPSAFPSHGCAMVVISSPAGRRGHLVFSSASLSPKPSFLFFLSFFLSLSDVFLFITSGWHVASTR